MKFIHMSDLHLGKRVNEYSMLEDQEYILKKILGIIDREKPNGVIIAGDVYDKSVPSGEAVQLFDSFLTSISAKGIEAFVISGNHDSAERMSFGSALMEQSGIHISRVYNGVINPITRIDTYGNLNVYMLPFIKPANVRRFFEDEEIDSYTDAMRVAISQMDVNKEERNILITHQFVTGASRSESEEISVGGTDNVDVSVFEDFDYVALGHIHGAQNCSSQRVRYCGTPLKYSFSEASHNKSLTVVELLEKGEINISNIPLVPMRDMVEIKGEYCEVMKKSFYENTTYTEDYVHITLTDEEDVTDAIGKLRTVYKNLMRLDYDNKRTRSTSVIEGDMAVDTKSPMELFEDFYELQNNQPMNENQKALVSSLIEKIWEDEE